MPNPVFLIVKIVCFILMYLAVATLLLSLFIDRLAGFPALLDVARWRMCFGLYLVVTGVSTAAISSWRGEYQARQLVAAGKIRQGERAAGAQVWKIANAVTGSVFIVEGVLLVGSGLGVVAGWWADTEIFGTTLGRVFTLLLLVFPFLSSVFIGWAGSAIGGLSHDDSSAGSR